MATTTIADSLVAGDFTIDQLEGEDCALCGATFEPGQVLEQVFSGPDYDLYAHVECPTGGERR